MPLEQPNSVRRQEPALIPRLFTDHPRSLGMTWLGHGLGALRIAGELIAAGAACTVHALVPGWFTQSAGKTVTRLYAQMQQRKAGASNPSDWPDYEI